MDQKQNQCEDCAITLEFEREYYEHYSPGPLAREGYDRLLDAFKIPEKVLTLEELAKMSLEELRRVGQNG